MAITKRIVCLANSRKLHGRCVAGVELPAGKEVRWIRPVSARENQEVSEYERQYQDGSDPTLLDIIDVPLLEHRPTDHQQENWVLDPQYYWDKVGVFERADLNKISERGGTLWRNGISTSKGRNDRIPTDQASAETNSLKLVHVDNLELRVFAPPTAFGTSKRRVQARFRFDGSAYALWITDPHIEQEFLAKADGVYSYGNCFLTVSLGEPFDNFCYKLVAAVLKNNDD